MCDLPYSPEPLPDELQASDLKAFCNGKLVGSQRIPATLLGQFAAQPPRKVERNSAGASVAARGPRHNILSCVTDTPLLVAAFPSSIFGFTMHTTVERNFQPRPRQRSLSPVFPPMPAPVTATSSSCDHISAPPSSRSNSSASVASGSTRLAASDAQVHVRFSATSSHSDANHWDRPYGLVFTRDHTGYFVTSYTDGGTVCMHNAKTHALTRIASSVRTDSQFWNVWNLKYAPDDTLFAATTDVGEERLLSLNADTFKVERVVVDGRSAVTPMGQCNDFCFRPDSDFMYVTCSYTQQGGKPALPNAPAASSTSTEPSSSSTGSPASGRSSSRRRKHSGNSGRKKRHGPSRSQSSDAGDHTRHMIQKYNWRTGELVQSITHKLIQLPTSCVYNSLDALLYVCDFRTCHVLRFSEDLQFVDVYLDEKQVCEPTYLSFVPVFDDTLLDDGDGDSPVQDMSNPVSLPSSSSSSRSRLPTDAMVSPDEQSIPELVNAPALLSLPSTEDCADIALEAAAGDGEVSESADAHTEAAESNTDDVRSAARMIEVAFRVVPTASQALTSSTVGDPIQTLAGAGAACRSVVPLASGSDRSRSNTESTSRSYGCMRKRSGVAEASVIPCMSESEQATQTLEDEIAFPPFALGASIPHPAPRSWLNS